MTRALAASIALHVCIFALLALVPNAPVRRIRPEETIIPVNVITLPPLPMPEEIAPAVPNQTVPEAAAPPAKTAEPPPGPSPKSQAPRAPARNLIRTITPRDIVVPDLVAKMEPSPIVDTSLKDKIKARLKAPVSPAPPPPVSASPRSVAPPSSEAPRTAPVTETPAPARTAAAKGPTASSSPRFPAPTIGFEGPIFPHAWYVAIVQSQIFENWSPPQRLLVLKSGAAAVIRFTIKRDGTIRDVALKESSGYTLLDRSALEAVRGLSGLPPLPTDYREEDLHVVVHFQPVPG